MTAPHDEDIKQYVISVKVENRFGVLARVAGLFSARGYNIDSLAVSATEQEDVSVMTIVVRGNDRVIEQVKKQLNKLIDVIKVSDHSDMPTVERELVLVKVNAPPNKRPEIYQLGEIFRADIADISQKTITLGVKGDPDQVQNFIELLKPYGIKELMRTGRVSLLKE
ncbi:MAG TPA: acetolactate synthase small subunit [Spirochaetota bacterium]|nr:acetolactate synthase small subunit [Spirochaetota bacterium]HPC43007.1 acetolactate synthase small subunit [Spirochaetota bacterium]HPL16994.1 acetolactate synthase small subunit [Spirochaetota bacterium]HQF10398.1 acetolactate synthase small subunit [Spirochaetota bacterium]HQH99271.1 acetolactate synthase small subunit [Spirochaetota bacterium]